MKIATFDIESENYVKPFLVGFYDGMTFIYFEGKNCIQKFCEFLLNNIRKLYKLRLYAHFGGGYDFQFLLDYFLAKDLKVNLVLRQSQIIYFSVTKNNRSLKFYDSFALLPASLKKLTKSFNVSHEKLDEDRSIIYETYRKDKHRVIKYLKHDCIGLYEVIKQFEKIIKSMGGEIKLTLASTSYNMLLNHISQKHTLPIIKDFREYYFGGRVEVFQRYGEDLYYYDFNSLYPYVMSKYEYPISIPIKVDDLNEFLSYECGFIHCKIRHYEHFIPCLPFKDKKLIFPVGEFEGFFTLPEFKYAYNQNYIDVLDIYDMTVFESDKLFEDYVIPIYEKRKKAKAEGKDALQFVYKILLNSSYGKFAEKTEKEKIIKITEENQDLLEQYPLYNDKYGLIKITEDVNLKYVNVAIAAHITAYARLELLRKMHEIYDKGYNVFYCDTDSIITDYHLKAGKNLGELDLEHKIQKFVGYAPKVYAIIDDNGQEIVKAKGFPVNLTFKNIENLVFNNVKFEVKYDKWFKFKESIRRFGKCFNYGEQTKGIRSDYDKRIVYNKIFTKPIKIA